MIGNGRFCTTSFKVLYTLDRAWREKEREILNGYLLRRAYLRLGSCCSVKNCVRSTSGYALTSPGNRFRNHVVTGFSYNGGFIDIANIMRWIQIENSWKGFKFFRLQKILHFFFLKFNSIRTRRYIFLFFDTQSNSNQIPRSISLNWKLTQGVELNSTELIIFQRSIFDKVSNPSKLFVAWESNVFS